MNLSVEHILIFALVVCALYYLMGDCGVEGWDREYQHKINWCTKRMEKCLCGKTTIFGPPIGEENISCQNEVDKIMLPEIMRANQFDKCILYPYQDGDPSWLHCLDLP